MRKSQTIPPHAMLPCPGSGSYHNLGFGRPLLSLPQGWPNMATKGEAEFVPFCLASIKTMWHCVSA